MKLSRQWVFIAAIIVWLISLALMIYALVYAFPESWAKRYISIIGLFFLSFTQVVKKAFRYSYKSDRKR